VVALVVAVVSVRADDGAAAAKSRSASALGRFETAFFDPYAYAGPAAELAFRRARAAGATAVRLILHWSEVAPSGPRRPDGFDPAHPADPAYEWQAFDRQVGLAVSHELTPLVTVQTPPAWAEGPGRGAPGTARPDPIELGRFARAAALRYSGSFGGLPRVRNWQIWNEQNLPQFLNPQRQSGRAYSPHWYRRMLNAAAEAIHSVHRDNVVVTGGLAPFTAKRRAGFAPTDGLGPLHFMREMLCLTKRLTRTCRERSQFDVWAHHPYTSGGPTHHAYRPDDVSLGDLPEMRRVLMAAYRNGNIVARAPPRFWVTEFGWDTRPPDPKGVPAALHARWVAEGLYRMWQSGISLVTWFQLRDEPPITSYFQGGLYFRGPTIEQDRPKPALRAFRFPFVGFPRGREVYVWGRTPAGQPGRVLVEQSFREGWRRLGVLRTNRYGIFEHRFASKPVGSVRARSLRTMEYARPFSLKHHPDRLFNPFGLPTLVEPRKKGRP
jgi:hypothetical protein